MADFTPQKLSRVLDANFNGMSRMRTARVRFLNQMVGRFYAKVQAGFSEELKAAPVNLLHTATTTVVPNLVFNNPQIKMRTDILEYRDYSEVLALGVNRAIREMEFRMTLRKCVMDSIFAAGFLKMGLAASERIITIDGVDVNIGQPFAERVDPDDMILDMNARDWDEQSFIANRFTVSKEDAIRQGIDADLITRSSSRFDNPKGLREASALTGAQSGRDSMLFEKVDMVDMWIPSEQKVFTMVWRPGTTATQFTRIADHAGTEKGPYHMLGYTFVPDNILPVPPASIWFDLHILANRIARKIARQADKMRRVLIYGGEAVNDAEAIRDSMDGEAIRVNDVDGVKSIDYGGTTEDAYVYMDWIKRQFSEQAGSLDQLSGQSAGAETLGQSEILQANANVRLEDLQNQVSNFVGKAATDIAFFLHTDPLIELPLIRRTQGVDEQVMYTPEMRKGTFLQYMATVVPFSMTRQDPNVKIRRMLEFATTAVPAAAQAAQMLGPAFKIDRYLTDVAKEIGLDEVDNWVDFQDFKAIFMAQFTAGLDQGKAAGFAGGQAGGVNLGQPNPSQMGPTGGTSLNVERNSGRQEASGENQAARF